MKSEDVSSSGQASLLEIQSKMLTNNLTQSENSLTQKIDQLNSSSISQADISHNFLPPINSEIKYFNVELPSLSKLETNLSMSSIEKRFCLNRKPIKKLRPGEKYQNEDIKFRYHVFEAKNKNISAVVKPRMNIKPRKQRSAEPSRRKSQRIIEKVMKREGESEEILEDEVILEKIQAEDGSIFTVLAGKNPKNRNVECDLCLKVIQQKTMLTHISSKTHKERMQVN